MLQATAPKSKPGLFTRLLQALTGTDPDEEEDGGSGTGGSGTGGSGSSSAKSGEASAQQKKPGEPPAAAAAVGSQEPPAGWQLAICAAGLAALPVVGWSEWVLKTTGEPLSARLPACLPACLSDSHWHRRRKPCFACSIVS